MAKVVTPFLILYEGLPCPPRVRVQLSVKPITKQTTIAVACIVMAPRVGLEPTTQRLLFPGTFVPARTISSPYSDRRRNVGALVSSLYGALLRQGFGGASPRAGLKEGSHGVRLAPMVIGTVAFTVIPESSPRSFPLGLPP